MGKAGQRWGRGDPPKEDPQELRSARGTQRRRRAEMSLVVPRWMHCRCLLLLHPLRLLWRSRHRRHLPVHAPHPPGAGHLRSEEVGSKWRPQDEDIPQPFEAKQCAGPEQLVPLHRAAAVCTSRRPKEVGERAAGWHRPPKLPFRPEYPALHQAEGPADPLGWVASNPHSRRRRPWHCREYRGVSGGSARRFSCEANGQ